MELSIVQWMSILAGVFGIVFGLSSYIGNKIRSTKEEEARGRKQDKAYEDRNREQDIELAGIKADIANMKKDIFDLKRADGVIEDKLLKHVQSLDAKVDKMNDLLIQILNKNKN